MSKLAVALINFYQTYLSFDQGVLAIFAPGGACRSQPTCSEYTKQMVVKFGVTKGLGLGLIRVWRCR